jgi:hypothetical protein
LRYLSTCVCLGAQESQKSKDQQPEPLLVER